jgi:endonuclease YncB( thermonuclease family)
MLTLSLLLAFLTTAMPGDFVGIATVIDGDTLRVDGVKIRLAGIDAPEWDQTCGQTACGKDATDALRALVAGRIVICTPNGGVTYDRIVAACRTADQRDLGESLVIAGMAMDDPRYIPDYAALTAMAADSRTGMWAEEVQPGWEWRARAVDAPTDCAIKGNISGSGHIYHIPGSRSYAATRIDESRGERWFCSVEMAEASGWRAPR